MKTIKFLGLLWFMLVLFNCNNDKGNSMSSVIHNVYDNGRPYANLDKKLWKDSFSKKLNSLLSDLEKACELSKKRISESDYPDDKPLMVEGNLFTGGHADEPYDKFIIKESNEDSKICIVEFHNERYKTKWRDNIVFVKEDGKWKIDNVINNSNERQHNLQKLIVDLIKSENQ